VDVRPDVCGLRWEIAADWGWKSVEQNSPSSLSQCIGQFVCLPFSGPVWGHRRILSDLGRGWRDAVKPDKLLRAFIENNTGAIVQAQPSHAGFMAFYVWRHLGNRERAASEPS
jgi:hypothetical protein